MISTESRALLLSLFDEAVVEGAARYKVAETIGVCERTFRRWRDDKGNVIADQRPLSIKPEPGNKLSQVERDDIIAICNEPQYASLPPSQIVPKLADEGRYVASEASFYRVLKAEGQLNHRGRSKPRERQATPTTHVATGANQVWTWDISYMPSTVTGLYWYLYMIMDVFSRKIVGWEVHECESGELAKELLQRTVMREQCFGQPLVLHSDNGAPMKSLTLKAKMEELGIMSSHNRPRVSNDNAYSESLFRTTKYRPNWPRKGFDSLSQVRDWVQDFVTFYNHEHCHSGISFVTPAQRHQAEDIKLLENRKKVYESARMRNPMRWSGTTRNWERIETVALNPEKTDKQEQSEQVT